MGSIKIETVIGEAQGRIVGTEKSGFTGKIKLDPSTVVGNPTDTRSVGAEKSGTIGKVHLDTSVVIGESADGQSVGDAKRSGVPK